MKKEPQGAQGLQGLTGTGDKGIAGDKGEKGDKGTQGTQGLAGSFGGATFDYTFSTNTSVSDPGSGFIKLNNGTQTSATTASNK